jgi:hypothetical protein
MKEKTLSRREFILAGGAAAGTLLSVNPSLFNPVLDLQTGYAPKLPLVVGYYREG